jgi:hypothetical protein
VFCEFILKDLPRPSILKQNFASATRANTNTRIFQRQSLLAAEVLAERW